MSKHAPRAFDFFFTRILQEVQHGPVGATRPARRQPHLEQERALVEVHALGLHGRQKRRPLAEVHKPAARDHRACAGKKREKVRNTSCKIEGLRAALRARANVLYPHAPVGRVHFVKGAPGLFGVPRRERIQHGALHASQVGLHFGFAVHVAAHGELDFVQRDGAVAWDGVTQRLILLRVGDARLISKQRTAHTTDNTFSSFKGGYVFFREAAYVERLIVRYSFPFIKKK